MFHHVVLKCAFTLALFCCVVDADSQWQAVVTSVVQLPAVDRTAVAHKTSFSRNVALLDNYVAGRTTPPANITDWVGKVAALRTKYDITNPAAATRPRVVISGAGPMGLLTAVQLVIKRGGQDRITVLEKTNGIDARWNAIMVEDDAASLLTQNLSLAFQTPRGTSPWIGQLPELEYVFGAMLLAIGVEIKYNTMFVFACPNATHDSALVHTIDTPERDHDARHMTFDTTTFCSYDEHSLASELERIGIQGHHVEANVRVLIGADGTASSVRRSTLHGQSNETDSSFPAIRWATASLYIGSSDHEAPGGFTTILARPVELYAACRTMEPLLTHMTVSFDTADLIDTESLFDTFRIATVPRETVTPQQDVRNLATPFMKFGERITNDEFRSIVAECIHHQMSYIDAQGNLRFRVYVEFLFRHQASQIFRVLFGAVIKHMHRKDGWLIDVAKGIVTFGAQVVPGGASVRSLNPAEGDRVQAKADEDVALARQLVRLIFKLINTRPSVEQYFEGDHTSPKFIRMLEKVKIFDQQMRGTTSSAFQTANGKLKVIVVGDAARDSYYVHGNSVNSAFTAFSQHLGDLFAHSGPEFATSAQLYHTQLVNQFANFIGADIYYRCFCSCEPNALPLHVSKLLFEFVECNDSGGSRVRGRCTYPRIFSPTQLGMACSTQNATLFEASLKHFCDAAELQSNI